MLVVTLLKIPSIYEMRNMKAQVSLEFRKMGGGRLHVRGARNGAGTMV